MVRHSGSKAFILVVLTVVLSRATLPSRVDSAPQPQDVRQKEHAKLYHYRTGKNLPQLAATGTGDIVVEAAQYPGLWGLSPGPHPSYPHPFLVDVAARADAVVVGVTESSSSSLTEDQDFIFTDWRMTVEQVLKDNPSAPIGVNTQIVVTRPGGTLVISGRNVRAIETMFSSFQAGGRYLLFLYSVPTTGSYRAFNDQSFELLQTGVRKLKPGSLHIELKTRQDPQALLAEVRAAIAAGNS